MRLVVNLFCRDIERQLAFYRAVLGLSEIVASRSPIFRALGDDTVELGLNAHAAYTLLGLEGRAATSHDTAPVTAYPTFMVDAPSAVDAACARAVTHAGRILKGPYPTYYGQWQAVLEDPEGHVFRLASAVLPPGIDPARQPWRE
jgi:catechol 2,3-dioxygenase-like lactoylglutathione lyase family enzyme